MREQRSREVRGREQGDEAELERSTQQRRGCEERIQAEQKGRGQRKTLKGVEMSKEERWRSV